MRNSLLELSPTGLYCSAGGFHVDPWGPVERAVITHAHSDHLREGADRYLSASAGLHVARARLGSQALIDTLDYGQSLTLNGVQISLHPAGHILGSSQVRIEQMGRVTVVSGDYKVHADSTCAAFEPLACHTFITESTFGLPIYRWRPAQEVFVAINDWWRDNQSNGRASVLFAYALGKAQRLLAGVDAAIGPVFVHGAVARFVDAYAAAGVTLPAIQRVDGPIPRELRARALVVAPPSAMSTPWLRRFGQISTAVASGWMRVRGARRWRSVDRGFALSDHADWPGLLEVIRATGAETIAVTHGYSSAMVRWLTEQGVHAYEIPTRFKGENPEALSREAPGDIEP